MDMDMNIDTDKDTDNDTEMDTETDISWTGHKCSTALTMKQHCPHILRILS